MDQRRQQMGYTVVGVAHGDGPQVAIPLEPGRGVRRYVGDDPLKGGAPQPGRERVQHREHARELGVDHYLGKPYSEDELVALIGQYAQIPSEV